MTLFPDVPILKVQSEVSSLQYSSYVIKYFQLYVSSFCSFDFHLLVVLNLLCHFFQKPWNTYRFASTSILLQLPHLFIVYGRSPTDIVTSVHSYNISQNSVKGTLFADKKWTTFLKIRKGENLMDFQFLIAIQNICWIVSLICD